MTVARRLAVAVIALLFACGPSSPEVAAPGAKVVASNVVTKEGVALTSACTPSGPEKCFDATDDNCNGIIDEGCGSGTGVLQFMVAWGDSPADVDLAVTDPSGVKVYEKKRSTPAGLKLEKNCPEDGCHGQNVENVFFDGPEPPRGRYTVEVKLVDPHGAELPVRARLSARLGSRTYAMQLSLEPAAGKDTQGFAFEL